MGLSKRKKRARFAPVEAATRWWERVSWGGLVIIGPMICYAVLLFALDLVGLSENRGIYFDQNFGADPFKEGLQLDLYSISGRSEYALTAAIYFLVSVFAVIWAAPKIIARPNNPYGGALGIIIAGGASAFLYLGYWNSDSNLRLAFADEILRRAEAQGLLAPVDMQMVMFGFGLVDQTLMPSEMLARIHAVVYFFGNAAPWFLIVFAACCASFEPGTFGQEPNRSLRQRMALLQIAVVIGAANIVLSVAYLRAMLNWPTALLDPDLNAAFLVATTRYTAIWGAIGTLMLIAVLAPAYLSLTRHFDRVAVFERERDGDDYVSYQERVAWRQEHGLNLTSQEIIATGAAVLAPLFTSPTLEATEGGDPPSVEARIILPRAPEPPPVYALLEIPAPSA